MAKKPITIYDIAKKLNYSTSTISRALKDHHSIGKKTAEKIKAEAEKMGYRPNTLAAGLRNNRSKTIGVLISRINRPFMSSLISGIEDQAKKQGYTVIMIQCDDDFPFKASKDWEELEGAHQDCKPIGEEDPEAREVPRGEKETTSKEK